MLWWDLSLNWRFWACGGWYGELQLQQEGEQEWCNWWGWWWLGHIKSYEESNHWLQMSCIWRNISVSIVSTTKNSPGLLASSTIIQPWIIDWTEKNSAEALGFVLTRQNWKSLSFWGQTLTGRSYGRTSVTGYWTSPTVHVKINISLPNIMPVSVCKMTQLYRGEPWNIGVHQR